MIAEPPDQREVGGHHRDLAELRQRDRQRETDGLDELDAPTEGPAGTADELIACGTDIAVTLQSYEKAGALRAAGSDGEIESYVFYLIRQLRKHDGVRQPKC